MKSTPKVSRKTSAFTEDKYVKYAINYICSMYVICLLWPQRMQIAEKYTDSLKRDLGHSLYIKTREVKTFSTKTSRDVGMVPSVSKEHMCLHGKINWRKNFRNKEGYHSMLNNPG